MDRGGHIIRTIRQHIQHIGHFQTAGNPGRIELDETQELTYPFDSIAVYPELDFAAYRFAGALGADAAGTAELVGAGRECNMTRPHVAFRRRRILTDQHNGCYA